MFIKPEDLIGHTYGLLTVLSVSPIMRYRQHTVHCLCRCGNEVDVIPRWLVSGKTVSCGCHRKRRHGMSRTHLYDVYRNMVDRCCNPQHQSYDHYGGRGITVCEEWLLSFDAFVAWAKDAGYTEGVPGTQQSLDRIDVNGNYEPHNCRWATASQQQNNRRCNLCLTYNGVTHTFAEWAAVTGLPYLCIKQRRDAGWPVERILTQPVRPGVFLEASDGRQYSISEVAQISGVPYSTVQTRRKRDGWSVDELLAGHRFVDTNTQSSGQGGEPF